MNIEKIIYFVLSFFLFSGCSLAEQKVKEKIDVKSTLTSQNYFWQSDQQEFLFLNNNLIIARVQSYLDQHKKDGSNNFICVDTLYFTFGKWDFDSDLNVLEIAWSNNPQVKVEIDTNESAADMIYFNSDNVNSKIFDCSRNHISKMKLLDNRFPNIDSLLNTLLENKL